MNKILQIILAAAAVVQTILLVVILLFVVQDNEKANRLDRFFSAVSEDYRVINEGGTPAAPAVADNQGPPCIDPSLLDIQDEPFKGNPAATVTVVEYSDFECPFCARFFRDTYNQLIENYVDSGAVRFVYKDFPLTSIHPLAVPSAVAANCVLQELGNDSFFAFHDIVYERQRQLSDANISAWAQEVGLSESQLESCRNSAALEEEILADLEEGSRYGVTGTPAFFVNGRLLVGAQPYQAFQEIIDRALNGDDICGS